MRLSRFYPAGVHFFTFVLACAAASSFASPERLGPSSRRTGLVISELMYHPPARSDGRNTEFVELYNSEPALMDLSGYRLEGSAAFTFPTNTSIPGLGFLVIAPVPGDVESVYGLTNVLGPLGSLETQTNALPNDNGTERLISRSGAVLLETKYSDELPWPVAADGAGHSLVLSRPSFGEGSPEAWSASAMPGGSPGTEEPTLTSVLTSARINEIYAGGGVSPGYIEIYNSGSSAIDLSGCFVTDQATTNKYKLPAASTVPAGGFLALYSTTIGFAPNTGGGTIFLKDTDGTRIIDAVRFEAQEPGSSLGRFPNGSEQIYALAERSPGAANGPIQIPNVVINELMYHPISRDDDDQYVELYNRSTNTVDVGGWKLDDGISFTFPNRTLLRPDSYLVVARNAARLRTNYAWLNTTNTLGSFSGKLAGSGERVTLRTSIRILTTNSSGVATITMAYPVIDEVTYGTGGRWGQWSDGGGSSLELIDARANHRLASNWADSDESTKAPWTTVEATGVLDNGTGTPDELQMFLPGAGECLVDDVQVLNSNGANVIANSSFESGSSGWTAEGTQDQSSLETGEGYQSTASYHVRAVERGDTGANRIRTPLISALTPGATGTIRAKVRWLRGFPEFLLRLRGNYLEAPVEMAIPRNLGTPGLRNSKAAPNAGPAIYSVVHTPTLPAANQAVTVTARVEDPDGLSNLQLAYRIDPAATYSTAPMTDNGLGVDAVAGDGIYSGRIPGQSAGTLAAFYIRATDNSTSSETSLFPNDAPARECLVRFGETQPAGSFGTYRLWITQANFNKWSNRSKLNNTPLDVTFVYDNNRVIYNMKALFAGSPYISPGYNTPSGNLCGYTGSFPEDDQFLGTTDFVLDWPGRDNTAIEEQLSYWIADQLGLPNSYRRFIHLHVNGVNEQSRGSIYEDVQQPGGDMIKEWVPNDTGGQFYKIERWFEFSDSIGLMSDTEPRLENYTTTGGAKKLARYRWNWLPRAVKGSVNDYTNLFGLVDAVNAPDPEPYTSATETLANIEEMMGIFAVEHIVNNFDSWGHEIGKNMYAYKPVNGKWMTFMFDIDWVMKESAGHGYTPSADLFSPTDDPTISRMYGHPPFQRAYYRTVQKAVNGPLLATRINPLMDLKYAGLVANGVTRSAGQALAAPGAVKTWVSQRRAYLVQRLAAVAASFALTSNKGADFSSPTNVAVITGNAPIEVKSIRINGQEYPVQWTDVTDWAATLVLSPGVNHYLFEGLDENGTPLPGDSAEINVTFNGTASVPEGQVVLNEIMYSPAQPGGEYVELYNNSSDTAFDLSGWNIDGADFTFDPGTLLLPNQYLVAAKDLTSFMANYGNTVPVAGIFQGQLKTGGETLSLVRPRDGMTDSIVDQVTYQNGGAWPALPPLAGVSLQLVDPSQDNSRVANWRAVTDVLSNPPPELVVPITATWKYNQSGQDLGTAWFAPAYNDTAWPSGEALLYVEGSTLPAPKNTPLTIGKTTYYFRTHFQYDGALKGKQLQLSTVIDDGAVIYLNGQEISRLGMPKGTITYDTFSARLVGNATYEGPFLLRADALVDGDNVLAIEVHQNNTGSSDIVIGATLSVGTPVVTSTYTPGAANSVATDLPGFPAVWLNEIQPSGGSAQDNFGEHDPWVELYNSSASTIDLGGWSLSNGYTNSATWTFPAGITLAPGGYLIIWLDGQPEQSSASAPHASFRASSAGVLVLSYPQNGSSAVLDYLDYQSVPEGKSYGRLSNGDYTVFSNPSPGVANGTAAPPLPLTINEWMASNKAALADPADGHFDDWFEIYNPNATPVDLTGYALSDSLTEVLERWPVPAGTTIAGKGNLLVWADGDQAQNSPTNADLHASFKLNKAGDSIAIFDASGSPADSVTFGAQADDLTQGRFPDGSTNIVALAHPTPRAANDAGNSNSPEFTNVAVVAGTIQLQWTSQPGQHYVVQFKRSLEDAAWTALTEVIATGATTEVSDTGGGEAHRFYRISVP